MTILLLKILSFDLQFSYKTNIFIQTKWLLWRNILATSRDPMATKIQITQVIVTFFLNTF